MEYLLYFVGLTYLLSPAGYTKFCSFQSERICDAIFIFGIGYCFTITRKAITAKRIPVYFTAFDIILCCYLMYYIIRALPDIDRVNLETLYNCAACSLLYLWTRTLGATTSNMAILFFILFIWQAWFGVAEQTDCLLPGYPLALVQGSFNNTGIWGGYTACTALFLLGAHFTIPGKRRRILSWTSALAPLLATVISNSRAAWLSVMSGMGYYAFQLLQRSPASRKTWGTLAILVSLASGLLFFTSFRTGSITGRTLIWKITGQICATHPWGIGIDGFSREYMKYQGAYFNTGGNDLEKQLADDNTFAFNEGLRIYAEQGIAGLLFTLCLIGILFKCALVPEEQNKAYTPFAGTLVGWGVFSLFSYPASVFQLKIILVSLVGQAVSLQIPAKRIHVNAKTLAACVLLGSGILAYHAFKYRNAITQWQECKARETLALSDTGSKFHLLRGNPDFLANGAILLNNLNAQDALPFTAECARRRASYVSYIQWGRSLEAAGKYEKAAEVWRTANKMVPNRFTPLFLQMEMQEKLGQTQAASRLADTILAKPVKIKSAQLTWIKERAKQIKKNV